VPGDRRRTRVPDATLARAGGLCESSVPPRPSPVAALRGWTNGLLLPGCVPQIGTPWKASHSRGGLAGGRSSGAAPLACGWPLRFFLLEGDAMYAALAPASRPARRAPQLRWVPALTPAPSAWASPRKQEEHKLQRPAAQRPGERSARFSPPPLETQRPWEAQPPLRVAAAHSPQKKPSGKVCLFLFLALHA
jgi:hypothetical protein